MQLAELGRTEKKVEPRVATFEDAITNLPEYFREQIEELYLLQIRTSAADFDLEKDVERIEEFKEELVGFMFLYPISPQKRKLMKLLGRSLKKPQLILEL